VVRPAVEPGVRKPDISVENGMANTSSAIDASTLICEDAVIRSDENPHYVEDVKKHFPGCQHISHKGRRGCVTGQGELKRGGFDPLFTLNHTCAMVRDNLKRLARRTWCTTKKPERLQGQLTLYAMYHNEFLLKKRSRLTPLIQAALPA
jgi:hypothetical protein